MAKPLTDKECKDILIQAKQWSENTGVTVWNDFVNITTLQVDKVNFYEYGLTEFAMFGECLTIFNDRGYQIVEALINDVLKDVE